MKNRKDTATKVYLIFTLICLLGIGILAKVFTIQIVQGDHWQTKIEDKVYKVREITPTRGQILSDDGSLLATSVPKYNLHWDSKAAALDSAVFFRHLDSLSLLLSQNIRDKSSKQYKALFFEAYRNGNRYAKIAKNISHHQKKKLDELKYVRRSSNQNGLIFDRYDTRMKPFKELASRTIGLDREDYRVGLEGAFHEVLGGRPGQRVEQRIPGNFYVPVTGDYIVEPIEGADLVTSIDVHLQDVAHTALYKQVSHWNADWGTVVLMDVETGFIKAISNLKKRKNKEGYIENYNYAVGEKVEPGSTFKTAGLLAGLDQGLIHPEDTINAFNGEYFFYDRRMRDTEYKDGGHGIITAAQALAISSNIGTARLIKKAYGDDPQKLLNKYYAMGLGDSLGLSIKGEPAPVLHNKVGENGWSGISITQLAIGYELEQTPLQTLAFYNAIANDGEFVQPQFVTEIRQNGKSLKKFDKNIIRKKIASSKALNDIQKMLIAVADSGTGKHCFKNVPYQVAGKTGTSRVNKSGGYLDSKYRASFVGYFPADKPRYSCIVVISEPKGAYYASTIAAPVFKDLADKIYATEFDLHEENVPNLAESYLPASHDGYRQDLLLVYEELGIPYSGKSETDWVKIRTGKDTVSVQDCGFEQGLVPDVRGMGLKDALYLLENAGLKVNVNGYGTVKTQSVTPGSNTKYHKKIEIKLS